MAKKGTAVIKWEEKLAAMADAAAAAEQGGGGNFLSLRGGMLAYQGNAIPGDKINVIVLDSLHERQYFDDDYDPDTPQSPACYAFAKAGEDEDEMAPHEKAPHKQSETCACCEWAEWGSSDKGRGQACKQVRRLSLILADQAQTPAAIKDAEEVYLKVPVTSVKAWRGYVQQIAALKRPPFAVVTEISVVKDPKTQFRVQFRLVSQITKAEQFEALMTRHETARKTIDFPYPDFAEEEAAAPARKTRKAKAAKKPAAKAQPAARKKRKF